jgi:hypothetical protein
MLLPECCSFFVSGSKAHGLLEAEDPEVSELCKQIKLEQPDIDDAASMLPEEACTLVAEFHDDTGESIVPDDAIAGNTHTLIFVLSL